MKLALPIVALIILIGLAWLLFEIVRQQGRILLRLGSIQDRLDRASALGAFLQADEQDRQWRSEATPAELRGISEGEPFPTFSFPDLSGREVSLFVTTWAASFCLLTGAPLL